jgi:hypothetical protein
MSRKRALPRAVMLSIGTVAFVLALACGDTTGPAVPRNPIAGTYDLTTVLNTYTFPTGDYLSGTGGFATSSAGGASLVGTLIISDSVDAGPATVLRATASVMENPFPTAGHTFANEYLGDLAVRADSMGISMNATDTNVVEHIVLSNGTFAGDSIFGTLDWQTKQGPAATLLAGTFVARRRR